MTSWGVLISVGAKNIGSANWLLIFPAVFLVVDAVRAELRRRRPARRARPEGPLRWTEKADPRRSATSTVSFRDA